MRLLSLWCPVVLGLLLGCGGPSGPGSAQRPSPEDDEDEVPAMTDVAALPTLGDYLPPLDKGRIEIAVPEGWYVPPASSKYVVRFQPTETIKYPCVVVTAEDYQEGGISTVTRKNAREFADQVASSLKKERSAVQPFEVGGFIGVAYRKRGKEPQSVSKILELFYLDTVVAGRKYSIHLRSREGSLEMDQPFLYTVVGGIKFAGLKTSPRPEEKKVKEDDQEQAEEKPAEEAEETEKAEKKPEKKVNGELDLDKLDELLKKE